MQIDRETRETLQRTTLYKVEHALSRQQSAFMRASHLWHEGFKNDSSFNADLSITLDLCLHI